MHHHGYGIPRYCYFLGLIILIVMHSKLQHFHLKSDVRYGIKPSLFDCEIFFKNLAINRDIGYKIPAFCKFYTFKIPREDKAR